METITGSVKGHIYHLELNRPQNMNAMSPQFFKDMQTAYEIISKLDDIRVVVVTAKGKHFSAGLDLKEAPNMFNFPDTLDSARKSIRIYDLIKDWQKSMCVFQTLRVPVIVGIQGYCLGGGIDLITSGDIRICTDDAKFSIKEIDIGMAPDIGTLQRLGVQNANISLFRELAFTGRIFNAQEALTLGLVGRVVKSSELESELFKLADVIVTKSPVGIYAIKSSLNREQNLHDNLDVMARTNMSMLFTNDVLEAMRATMTKSKAEFPKL